MLGIATTLIVAAIIAMGGWYAAIGIALIIFGCILLKGLKGQ